MLITVTSLIYINMHMSYSMNAIYNCEALVKMAAIKKKASIAMREMGMIIQ